jgi:hypothetical protein
VCRQRIYLVLSEAISWHLLGHTEAGMLSWYYNHRLRFKMVKFFCTPWRLMEGERGSTGIAPHTLNLGARRAWPVTFTSSGTNWIGGWVRGPGRTRSGRFVEKNSLMPLRGFEHRTVHPLTARRKYLTRCQSETTVLLSACRLQCCSVPAGCSTPHWYLLTSATQRLLTTVLLSACRLQ